MKNPTIQHGHLEHNKFALTFDDGPDNYPLENYLQALEQCGAPGTFFFTGEWLDKHPEQAREVLARGHELALHSYHHRRMSQLPKEVFIEEIQENELAYQEATGLAAPSLIRFPYLDHSQENLEWLTELGYFYIAGEDSGDWEGLPSEKIIENSRPFLYQGAIIFFHANDIAQGTPGALKPLIREAQQQGLQPVTVSEMLFDLGLQPKYRSWKINIELPDHIANPPEDWVAIASEAEMLQLASESADWGIPQFPRGASSELTWYKQLQEPMKVANVEERRELFSTRRFANQYWGYFRAGVQDKEFVLLDFAAKEAQADTLVYLLRWAAVLAKQEGCQQIIARRDIRRLQRMCQQLGWQASVIIDG